MLFSYICSRWSWTLIAVIIGKVMSFPVESEGRGEAFIYLLVWPNEWALLRVGGMLTIPSRGSVRGDGTKLSYVIQTMFLILKNGNSWCIMFLKTLTKKKIFDSFVTWIQGSREKVGRRLVKPLISFPNSDTRYMLINEHLPTGQILAICRCREGSGI